KPAPGPATSLRVIGDHAARQREIQQMVDNAFKLPDADARTAADVLMASDKQSGKLIETLDAIDRAMKVIAVNLSNADTTAYKATKARCDGSATPVLQYDMAPGSLESTV